MIKYVFMIYDNYAHSSSIPVVIFPELFANTKQVSTQTAFVLLCTRTVEIHSTQDSIHNTGLETFVL